MKSLFREKVTQQENKRKEDLEEKRKDLEKRRERFLRPALQAKKLLEELIEEDKEFKEHLWHNISIASRGIPLRPLILDAVGCAGSEDRTFLCLRRSYEGGKKNITLTWCEYAILRGNHAHIIEKMQTKEGIVDLLFDNLGINFKRRS